MTLVQCLSVQEISRDIAFRGQGRRLLTDDLSPRQFVERLIAQDQYPDAIRFLAHALPKRQAVWWGCLCLWQAYRPEPDAAVQAVLQAAVRWVQDPSEAHRRQAEAAGRLAGSDTPAGCLGRAVFWSGGSMSRPDLPPIAPPPLLCAQAVSAAVLLAAAQSGTAPVRRQRRREFVAMALQEFGGSAGPADATTPAAALLRPASRG